MTARIPLRKRDGTIIGYALVDAADAEWLRQWTWRQHSREKYAYRVVYVGPKRCHCIFMHRAILSLSPGDGLTGDHINRDRLDNRRSNLRVLTAAEQTQNIPARSGRFRGVSWNAQKRRWQARARINGRTYSGGYFTDEEEAARAAAGLRARHLPFSQEALKAEAPALHLAMSAGAS